MQRGTLRRECAIEPRQKALIAREICIAKGRSTVIVESIVIKYDTGQLDIASGDAAGQIFAWWAVVEQRAMAQGIRYAGAKLKRVDCIDQVDEAPADGLAISDGTRDSDNA